MLPLPEEINSIVREDPEDIFKSYLLSYMIDNLSDIERAIYGKVQDMLREKMNAGKITIDLEAMMKWADRVNVPITECMCRRMINKFEYEETGKKIFIIENGSKAWHRYDKIRRSQVQKGGQSSGQQGV